MIYILEDDASILKLVMYTLNKEGLENKGFERPSDFYIALEKEIPELIILDIMLPEEDGITILKKIKKESAYANVPIIMLTAKSSEFDKVLGLDMGADDYIAKPFGIMELLARIKALLRRCKNDKQGKELNFHNLSLNEAKHLVKVDDETIELTYKEFELLKLLMMHPGICFKRDDILDKVWGYDFIDSSRTVDVHIRSLRSKLKDAGGYIKTIRGVGYKIGD